VSVYPARTCDKQIGWVRSRRMGIARPRLGLKPLKPFGGLVILKGNLVPDGAVLEIAGQERVHHRGAACVFECEEDAFAAVSSNAIRDVRVRRSVGCGRRRRLNV
jgi:dihydroxyacid dehydratase/phosphogluconate dehydratase